MYELRNNQMLVSKSHTMKLDTNYQNEEDSTTAAVKDTSEQDDIDSELKKNLLQ